MPVQKKQVLVMMEDWEKLKASLIVPNAKYPQGNTRAQKEEVERILEEKRCRKQEKEDYLNRIAAEEVEEKKKDTQEHLDKANHKLFLTRDCVRNFNSGLMSLYVREENEALSKFQQDRQKHAEEQERKYEEEERRLKVEKDLRQEQDKSHQRRKLHEQVHENMKMIKEKKLEQEKEKEKEKEERDRRHALDVMRTQELRNHVKKEAANRRMTRQSQLEDISVKKLYREQEAQKSMSEDLKIARDQIEIETQKQQRQFHKNYRFRERQVIIDEACDILEITNKQQAASRTMRENAQMSKKEAEAEAERTKKLREKKAKDAETHISCNTLRENRVLRKEQEKKELMQSELDLVQAKQEADMTFLVNEEKRVTMIRNKNIKCRDLNIKLAESRHALQEKEKKEAQDAENKIAMRSAKRQQEFEEYVQTEIQRAAGSRRFAGLKAYAPGAGDKCKDQPGFLPPINSKHLPAGRRYPSTRVESSWRTTGTEEALPRFSTEKSRSTKQHLERNKIDLTYKEYGPQLTHPKHTATKQTPAGIHRHHPGPEGSMFSTMGTREPLPRLATEKTRFIKQHLERNKLQLSYKDNSMVSSIPLPPIVKNERPAGLHNPPPGTEKSPYCTADTSEPLRSFATDKTRSTKKLLERRQRKPAHVSTINVTFNPHPPILSNRRRK
ncbi:trichohyalin-like isoform X2 [Notolabrus celidotus]|uniref:trichohyalin-like isoform X2 n=1 Tax=Notolabrus celidotus TaxID=1203425 RepID=UPI00148F4750|nr:trichohyalin-like isoform X2 [Notolabrus celidotus]